MALSQKVRARPAGVWEQGPCLAHPRAGGARRLAHWWHWNTSQASSGANGPQATANPLSRHPAAALSLHRRSWAPSSLPRRPSVVRPPRCDIGRAAGEPIGVCSPRPVIAGLARAHRRLPTTPVTPGSARLRFVLAIAALEARSPACWGDSPVSARALGPRQQHSGARPARTLTDLVFYGRKGGVDTERAPARPRRPALRLASPRAPLAGGAQARTV
jgi:hypothetical protein